MSHQINIDDLRSDEPIAQTIIASSGRDKKKLIVCSYLEEDEVCIRHCVFLVDNSGDSTRNIPFNDNLDYAIEAYNKL